MIRDPKTIRPKADFLVFLDEFRADLEQNREEWENPTLERFLDAMESWIDACDNYYRNTNQPVQTNINWRFIADALMGARIHE